MKTKRSSFGYVFGAYHPIILPSLGGEGIKGELFRRRAAARSARPERSARGRVALEIAPLTRTLSPKGRGELLQSTRNTYDFRRFKGLLWGVISLSLLLGLTSPVFANVVKNPSFEIADPSSAKLAAFWTTFNRDTPNFRIADRRDSGATPDPDANTDPVLQGVDETGTRVTDGIYALNSNGFGGTSSGVFQDVFGVVGGTTVSVLADVRTPNMGGIGDGFARISLEFYDKGGSRVTESRTNTTSTGSGYSTNRRVTQVAPTGAAYVRVVLTCAEDGGAGDCVFDNIRGSFSSTGTIPDNQAFPISLSANSNRSTAKKGDVITVTVLVKNDANVAATDVELDLRLPGGFNLIGETVLVGGQRRVVTAIGNNAKVFVGDLPSGDSKRVVFQVLVTSGVLAGRNYDLGITALSAISLGPMSPTTHKNFLIIRDPTFELATILGKVFDDQNENGVQDKGEKGIAKVRIATEEGVVVYTDRHGRYHIPGVSPGRHVVKIDGHSLPIGTKWVSEKAYLTRVTEGLLSKVSFAVKLPGSEVPAAYQDTLQYRVVEDIDHIEPQLNLKLSTQELRMGKGILENDLELTIDTNYAPLIHEWRVDIYDEMGEEVWIGIGRGAPPSQISWDGKTNFGSPVEPGDYAIRLIVNDREGREDWTPLQFFRVLSKVDRALNVGNFTTHPRVGFFNIMKEGKRSIPVKGNPLVRVHGKAARKHSVLVNGESALPDEEGYFEKQVFVPDREKKLTVQAISPTGESLTSEKNLNLKKYYFFFTGLAEEELGISEYFGNFETLASEDRFRDGFHEDHRSAYYLKGRFRDYLITSSWDSERENEKVFTKLDPDDYYPTYGDQSEIHFDGSDTQNQFYAQVERGRSFARYGGFETNFNETQLLTHNRSLSGTKVHVESERTSSYGEPKFTVTAFQADQGQKPDHNEFRGTGGSLYFLRHRRVVEGTEKLRIEVRDRLQETPIASRDLVSGVHYEVDYDEGRIILKEPLMSTAQSDTVISNEILDGHSQFLIVDYEFQEPGLLQNPNRGFHGTYLFGDSLRIGGLYVEDRRGSQSADYRLRGVHGTANLGKNTRFTAELGESTREQLPGVFSNDGGFNFSKYLTEATKAKTGVLLKGETKFSAPFEVSGFFQEIDAGFSNGGYSFSQQGFRKWGGEARYRLQPNFAIRVRQDNLELLTKSLAAADIDRFYATTVQGEYDAAPWKATAEYKRQHVEVPLARRERVDSFFSVNDYDHAVGAKVSYQVNDAFTPFVRGQVTIGSKPNHQLGVGMEAKANSRTTVQVEQAVGTIGDATRLGIQTQGKEGSTSYAQIEATEAEIGGRKFATTLGGTKPMGERSRLVTERHFSSYQGDQVNTHLVRYETTLWDRFGFGATFQRSYFERFDEGGVNLADAPTGNPPIRNAASIGLSYKEEDWLESSSELEFRWDRGLFKNRQWFTTHFLELQPSEDFEFFGRLNYSAAREYDREQHLGNFTELNAGFAYRPVEYDWFNFLFKYSYLVDEGGNVGQQFPGPGLRTTERSQIVSGESSWDIGRRFQLVEKLAFKLGRFESDEGLFKDVMSYLWVHRINFHITRKWDLALEFRILIQEGAGDNFSYGPLIEIDRELFEYFRLGLGYNFAGFSDNLENTSDFRHHGWFLRMTGKI